MWEIRDMRFGGLKFRYRDNKGQLIRVIDPFTATEVKFSKALNFDNWLLRAFTPGAVQCSKGPVYLPVLKEGKYIEVKCDLVTEFSDGLGIADMVVATLNSKAQARWIALQEVAPTHHLKVALRTRDVVWGNTVLLENLDMMRQHLVSYPCRSTDWVEHAVKHALSLTKESYILCEDVKKLLANAPAGVQSIHSALFTLYRKKEICIDIAVTAFGPASKITTGKK